GPAAGARPLVELLRQVHAVERVDDVEQLEGVAHLVGLQVADQMPRNWPADLAHLVARLLDPILTERRHPRVDRLPDPRHLHGLRDTDQQHVRGTPTRTLRGPGDPFTYPIEIGANIAHGRVNLTGGGLAAEGEGPAAPPAPGSR